MKIVLLVCSLTLAFAAVADLSAAKDKAAAKSKAAKTATVKAEFDGHCAMGACDDHFVKGDPKVKLEKDGKTYYFANEEAKKSFEADLDANLKKAHERKINRKFGKRGISRSPAFAFAASKKKQGLS